MSELTNNSIMTVTHLIVPDIVKTLFYVKSNNRF